MQNKNQIPQKDTQALIKLAKKSQAQKGQNPIWDAANAIKELGDTVKQINKSGSGIIPKELEDHENLERFTNLLDRFDRFELSSIYRSHLIACSVVLLKHAKLYASSFKKPMTRTEVKKFESTLIKYHKSSKAYKVNQKGLTSTYNSFLQNPGMDKWKPFMLNTEILDKLEEKLESRNK